MYFPDYVFKQRGVRFTAHGMEINMKTGATRMPMILIHHIDGMGRKAVTGASSPEALAYFEGALEVFSRYHIRPIGCLVKFAKAYLEAFPDHKNERLYTLCKNMGKHEKICKDCGQPFSPKSPKAETCSDKCRQSYSRSQRLAGKVTPRQ